MRELFGDLLTRIPVLESLPLGDVERLMESADEHLGDLDQSLEGILPADAPVDDLIDLLPIR